MCKTWEDVKNFVERGEGLHGRASRDFCALECLANDPRYAKPDSQKIFLLWEANLQKGIKIEVIPGIAVKHSWVLNLFIDLEKRIVRFPFNTGDTEESDSLSWETIDPSLHSDGWEERMKVLPRWSTASRSCLALIPKNCNQLISISIKSFTPPERVQISPKDEHGKEMIGIYKLNKTEWDSRREEDRFYIQVRFLGTAVSEAGISFPYGSDVSTGKFRLYSVKTGVKYVGSRDESVAGKNRLEANCSMAMLRSQVIESLPNNDITFGVQTEVLTISAPTILINEKVPGENIRDGFQVRDLSCMRAGLDYIPGQAIPYGYNTFTPVHGVDDQCDFWRKAFAIPLGRAKARLFLNYGLIHTSANAQNFLLGFSADVLKQFVARDLGDTSWHDDYIETYFKEFKAGAPVLQAFWKESFAPVNHTLHKTTSGDYPPPHMIRLAAYSVLTHDFAKVLIGKNGWTDKHVYLFATGILDGFRDYMMEALLLSKIPGLVDQDLPNDGTIKDYGVRGKYPTDLPKLEDYQKLVDGLLRMDSNLLISLADFVRQRGEYAANADKLDDFGEGAADGINVLINAEEILLCAGFEVLMGLPETQLVKPSILTKLTALFNGSQPWPPIVK